VALVLGLGNPGSRFSRTRHNVGWRVLELLEQRATTEPGESTATYRTVRATREGRTLDLMYPLTFMNASGQALEAWRAGHELDPAALLVVADDVYLPIGAMRLRERGSSGGHLGLESIEAVLGSREYSRLRIGVGHADADELREHVLEGFEQDEETAVAEVVALAAEAVECWAGEGMTAAMNRFNRKLRTEEGQES
jgi:PTH1 family peptidyl-tRNA hydrolase